MITIEFVVDFDFGKKRYSLLFKKPNGHLFTAKTFTTKEMALEAREFYKMFYDAVGVECVLTDIDRQSSVKARTMQFKEKTFDTYGSNLLQSYLRVEE